MIKIQQEIYFEYLIYDKKVKDDDWRLLLN